MLYQCLIAIYVTSVGMDVYSNYTPVLNTFFTKLRTSCQIHNQTI